MKKIISLVCVIAMMFAFAVTVNAAESSLDLVQKELTAETAVYDVVLTTDYYTNGIGIYLDLSDAVAKGATVTVVKVNAGTARYVAAKKMALMTFAPTDGSTLEPGATTLATITFNMTNVTEAFAITKMAESAQTTTTFKHKDMETLVTSSYLDEIAYNYDVTVAPFSAETPFEPSTEKGALVEGTDDIVLEKDPAGAYKNTFLGTALFEATLGADVKYSEAGFIWVKDDVETANKYTVDASVIAGGGTFEYGVAMYGIPANVDIDAIPYYVTAE